jgi:diaminopimelate decarboxylase
MSMTESEPRQRSRSLPDTEITKLARSHGTPLYIYDLVRLRDRIEALREAMAGANGTLFFATMANDRIPILKLMAKLGLGACVNSVPHLALAIDCGFAAARIQFTSTGMPEDDMRLLQTRGVRCNLDSLPQLSAWCELGAAEAKQASGSTRRLSAADCPETGLVSKLSISDSRRPWPSSEAQR